MQQPTGRRLPAGLSWQQMVVAVVIASLAAIATYVVLDGGEDDAVDPETAATLGLEPVGPAPEQLGDVRVVDTGRNRVALARLLGGRPAVVNFFASNCAPCVLEMPAIERVHQDLGDDVAFVGLAVNDRPEDAAALVRRTGVTYATYRDPDATAYLFFDAIRLPTTVFLDARGRVVEKHTGELTEDELREQLRESFGVG